MKNILIIGASEFGKLIANSLIELNNEIMLVDKNQEVVDSLSNEYENILVADCRSKYVLEQLGVKNYDACIVSVGGSFQDSLEITSNLKENGAKYIISQCSSDIQAKFLIMAGANKTVFIAKEAADKIAHLCSDSKTLDYISLNKDYIIVKIKTPEKWLNHTLPELDLRNKYNINVLAVEANNEFFLPDLVFRFQKENLVMILGNRKSVSKFLKK